MSNSLSTVEMVLRETFGTQSTISEKLTIREQRKLRGSYLFEHPAVIIDIYAPDNILNLLRALEASGHEDPIAFGGALRDYYLKEKGIVKPRGGGDIDIALRPSGYDEFSKTEEGRANNPFYIRNMDFLRFIRNQLEETVSGITSTKITKSNTYKQFDANIQAQFTDCDGNSQKLDLCISDDPFILEMLAMEGDAPINSIAMNSKGIIMAHPKFEQHARLLTYQNIDIKSSEIRAKNRFSHLRAKIPGLIDLNKPMGKLRGQLRRLISTH
jgi:hypothetical protein